MTTDIRTLEDSERDTRKTPDMHLVRSSACSSADGIVAGKFDMWKVDIPAVLLFFVGNYIQRLSHGVWLTRSTSPLPSGWSITVGMVGARCQLANTD